MHHVDCSCAAGQISPREGDAHDAVDRRERGHGGPPRKICRDTISQNRCSVDRDLTKKYPGGGRGAAGEPSGGAESPTSSPASPSQTYAEVEDVDNTYRTKPPL